MLNMGIPFYLSLGNHDMLTEKGKEVIQTFQMPAGAYYTKHLGVIDVFAINTSAFDMPQQLWLKQALMSSKAPWKLVYGHHPLYSTGAHGHDADLVQLREQLEPILTNYKADAYLAGHDHNYERFASSDLPYLHLVSGGGGAYLRTQRQMPRGKERFPKTAHYAIKYHYLDLSVTPSALTIQARDTNNNAFDSVTLTK
jgi:3',5'-cyclic AMP phosphodiesterase CpdA